jgi:hypothetical protein
MIDLLNLPVGARLRLQADIEAEVVENMGDGQWVMVRYLVVPSNPTEVGSQELAHAQDIVEVLSEPETPA